jgi:hypothetical protein
MIRWLRRNFKFLRYILRHKWLVFRECCRLGIVWRGITHDASKLFMPDEFLAYAEYWVEYGWPRLQNPQIQVPAAVQARYRKAYELHRRRNSHHWEYWISVDPQTGAETLHDMDETAIKEMVADWQAVGRMLPVGVRLAGAQAWYQRQRDKMRLSPLTRQRLEQLLSDLYND